jgi:uncharacterized membrane protein
LTLPFLYLNVHPKWEYYFFFVNGIEEKKPVRVRNMGDFNTEAFTLLAVAIVIIGLRTTARWIMVGPKNFQADDYLMLVACVSLNLILQWNSFPC